MHLLKTAVVSSWLVWR